MVLPMLSLSATLSEKLEKTSKSLQIIAKRVKLGGVGHLAGTPVRSMSGTYDVPTRATHTGVPAK